jgi:uncharacterized protein YgiM (DUF1202 family)
VRTRLTFTVRALVVALLLATAISTFGGVRGVDARSCDPCPVVATDALNLRSGPSLNDTITWVIPKGTELIAANATTNGFREVEVEGREGWAYGQYLVSPDVADVTGTLYTTDYLNLRQGPSTDEPVLDVMLPLSAVEATDQVIDGFRFVYFDGLPGWAFNQYLVGSQTMTTTDVLNLRAEPSTSAEVRHVMPLGATVELTGDESNGFLSVTYNGVDGWAYAEFLS